MPSVFATCSIMSDLTDISVNVATGKVLYEGEELDDLNHLNGRIDEDDYYAVGLRIKPI